jgi:carbon monoxide dehydrogenase subunit G
MQLQYSGTIPVHVDEAWAALSDLQRVAACVPGVRLDQVTDSVTGGEVTGDEVAGTVTVPLGPLRLTYRGEAAFVERDEEARRVVIDAAGRDSHGEQAASARITAQLRPDGEFTQVTAVAEVNVRGMSAPVGFAVGEFGTGLLRQFVTHLGASTPARATASAAPQAQAKANPSYGSAPEPASTPASSMAGPESGEDPLAATVYPVPPPRRDEPSMFDLAPLAGSLAVGALIGWLFGRRGRRSS